MIFVGKSQDKFEIERQRRNLNILIGEWINREKEPNEIKKLVSKYNNLTSQLKVMGVNVGIKSPHLNPEYWDSHTASDFKASKKQAKSAQHNPTPPSQPTQTVEKIVEKVKYVTEKNYYILRIAWDDHNNVYKDIFDKEISPFISEIDLKYVSKDCCEFDNRCEWMYKYEFTGSSESFNVIKTCLGYLFKHNNMNAEIFGKKMNKT